MLAGEFCEMKFICLKVTEIENHSPKLIFLTSQSGKDLGQFMEDEGEIIFLSFTSTKGIPK